MTGTEFEVVPFEFEQQSPVWEAETRRGAASRASPGRARPPRPRPPARRPWPAAGGFVDRLPGPCVCPAHGTEFIRWVQSTLNRVGAARLPVDGIMSAAARSALRDFQRRKGLPADGIAGPDTEQALRDARRPANAGAAAAEPPSAQEFREADEFEALEFESPAAFEAPASATNWQRVTSPSLEAMTCQLMCASNLAYAPKPLDAPPYYAAALDQSYYKRAGFIDKPSFIQGKKVIDACLIGTFAASPGGQRNIVLAFRGTVVASLSDWLNDAEAVLVPFKKVSNVLVHKGFNDSIESFFGRGIVSILKDRLKASPGAKVYVTGHSKGGALAYLGAFLLRSKHPEIPLGGVISFEAPRAGHPGFASAYNASGIETLRFEFQNDIVPHLPPSGLVAKTIDNVISSNPKAALALGFLYPKASRSFAYEHAGTLRFINWNGAVVGDSAAVQAERIVRLPVQLTAAAFGGPIHALTKLASWHAISCAESANDTSASWRALCKTEVCG